MNKQNAIGVIDSGVGGLTVAKEILSAMPDENIIYLGDSANCPYGNKTEEEILDLSLKMIGYMEKSGVKCVAIACNTISTLIEKIRPHFDFPIVSIVECAAKAVIQKQLSSVGLIATNFTVNSGNYNKLINKGLPDCSVLGVGSANLAALVDAGHTDDKEIDDEITLCVDKILANQKVNHIILGCTHYPIVYGSFKKNYPEIEFINPAIAQMSEVKAILKENGAQNTEGGSFKLFSTGDTSNYLKILKLLGARLPDSDKTITI